MLGHDEIRAAADDVVAAALIGQGWQAALQRFARVAGARDAVLMRNAGHRMMAAVVTEEAVDGVADFAAGRAPPNSRYHLVKSGPHNGFRIDHDDYTAEQLARDPYYQEFLRRHGLFWHANVILLQGSFDAVELSLKRAKDLLPYRREDAAVLDTVLPQLRAAVRIARATLDAEARGMAGLLRLRGEQVFCLDFDGTVIPEPGNDQLPAEGPVRVRRNHLVVHRLGDQRNVDIAIAAAIRRPGHYSAVMIEGREGQRCILQVLPTPGLARDVFGGAAAVAVLIGLDDRIVRKRVRSETLRSLFALTEREIDIAIQIAEGIDMAAICQQIDISLATGRSYLKSIFEKTGVHRQAELAALIARVML